MLSSLVSTACCLANSSGNGTPLAICAATAAPAEVPTIRSAVVRSTPAPRRPATMPSSQAIPVTPPPANTSARLGPCMSGLDGDWGLLDGGEHFFGDEAHAGFAEFE